MHLLHNAISPKLLSTIKHSYEHDESPSHEHIANQELSFHMSVIDITILASPMYSLGLPINPFASGSACGKNPYTKNANTSYYPAVLTFSYVQKLVLPPMILHIRKPHFFSSVLHNSLLPSLTKTEARLVHLQESKPANLAQQASMRWMESEIFTSTSSLLIYTRQLYETLYSAESIDLDATHNLIQFLPLSDCLSLSSSASLIYLITASKLESILNLTPINSSPGLDGLPYPLLATLLSSRTDAYFCLLIAMPKYSPSSLLPGSILASDLLSLLSNPALYLTGLLLTMAFLPTLSFLCLFFSTQIHVNVNSFVLASFSQGDPLSSLLFNLAFDPLLPSIFYSPLILGFVFNIPSRISPPHSNLSCKFLKLLTYVNDLLILLSFSYKLAPLLSLLFVYGKASNAYMNLDKTIAISLSGNFTPNWDPVLTLADITSLHNHNSANTIYYLGFPLLSHLCQLDSFHSAPLSKLDQHCLVLAQCCLSVHGKSLVTNSLLLSTIWYVLYIMPVPPSFFTTICKSIRTYLSLGFGSPAWDLLCQL
ncbi:hypothetical protein PHYBLDRAFT_152067 [Phycomyces blakesleeanus NRRL 1555(-)]|uniref:Reverse transcriptase domain-containing protein n=1 Tax=Phycomyces blakesleeanus (strain ATCC 8743b / DSM 1359 / FGSC 10004 / NBRC 33097 / NRRL 1555) TaxID=763407 RepID=A0A167JVZ6_PHYB8|nr:hypothetical protein PHYBLDRAFT_152067 [Phycomyces blakesleeanus NRRL 1555(-)]OAD66797.1 hypothetical protein PHYBLDRAFT_152067 [Phycomyces blakesleeanus NRRL 1555(-)]|eukprot:XP_018284837.1 hypothetical protein PHYBLDRAFT_152067 [Phycomyces blakesleeanus NRRL 1555(-)]